MSGDGSDGGERGKEAGTSRTRTLPPPQTRITPTTATVTTTTSTTIRIPPLQEGEKPTRHADVQPELQPQLQHALVATWKEGTAAEAEGSGIRDTDSH